MLEGQTTIHVVHGPTASGKTSLAIDLALCLNTEVISFDSRQFYKELNIGVARPTILQLNSVKHHFIATNSIKTPLNAFEFATLAKPLMDNLIEKNGAVVLVGGSALFADALLLGLDSLPHNKSVQAKWNTYFENHGLRALQEQLKSIDPKYYEQIDQMNPMRLIRALEIGELTGKSNLELRTGERKDPPYIKRYFIDWPRAELYQRINERVDTMIAEGLENEAKKFYPNKLDYKSLKTVGYQEFFSLFSKQWTREQAIDKIKQHSRNYAKRQLTWLGKYADIQSLNPNGAQSLVVQALNLKG